MFFLLIFIVFLGVSCNNQEGSIQPNEVTDSGLKSESINSKILHLALQVSKHKDFIYVINKMKEIVPANCGSQCVETQINIFSSRFANVINDIPSLQTLSLEEQAKIFQDAEEFRIESSMGCKMFCFSLYFLCRGAGISNCKDLANSCLDDCSSGDLGGGFGGGGASGSWANRIHTHIKQM
jgi:hypothetical protein